MDSVHVSSYPSHHSQPSTLKSSHNSKCTQSMSVHIHHTTARPLHSNPHITINVIVHVCSYPSQHSQTSTLPSSHNSKHIQSMSVHIHHTTTNTLHSHPHITVNVLSSLVFISITPQPKLYTPILT